MSRRIALPKGITIGALSLLLVVGLYFLFSGKKNFPAMPAGAYFGSISGSLVSSNPQIESQVPFYVERISDANALLIIVGIEGWKPRVVGLERSYESVGSSKLTEQIPFEPVLLQLAAGELVLSGDGAGKEFDGSGELSARMKGEWSLQRVDKNKISAAAPDVVTSEVDLTEWLNAQAGKLKIERSLESEQTELAAAEEQIEQLKEVLSHDDELAKRADKRLEVLRQQLKTIKSQTEEQDKIVTSLISELNLLGRITRRGKAVSLSRKLASRENKWYLANWRAQEDASGLEEYLLQQSNINLAELEREYQYALETSSLIRELKHEKLLIRDLENQLQTGSHSRGPAKRSVWDKLWGKGR